MVARGDYFCINRGRQYGKTTTLEALNVFLCPEYTVLKLSFEGASAESFQSLPSACAYFLQSILFNVRMGLTNLNVAAINILEKTIDGKDRIADMDFAYAIPMICKANDKPIVVLIDEVDQASNYESFLSFLGVLRRMFLNRNAVPTFQSVILAGVYDVKNLKLKLRPEELHQYNSPWNIAAPFDVDMSLSVKGIQDMLDEYKADCQANINTAQVAKWIVEYTSGYPFLVSRLCMLMDNSKDWSENGFLNAKKSLLGERNTLFDDMVKKIEQYPELKTMLQTILFGGESVSFNPLEKYMQLSEMFSFIKVEEGKVRIHNRIMETCLYEYFMSEEYASEIYSVGSVEKNQFVSLEGLNMPLLLQKFSEHFNEIFRNSDGSMDMKFVEKQGRKQFLLYLRPIINGVGHYYIEAETRDETKTDIIINYRGHEYVIELKIWRGDSYKKRGEEQLYRYLEHFKADTGYLVSFCFNKNKQPGLLPPVKIGTSTLIEAIV